MVWVQTGLQAILALALLRFGARMVVPTLAFVVVVALLPTIRAVLVIAPPSGMPSVIVYGLSLVVSILAALPFFLLLLPNPSRVKGVIAIIVFITYELVVIASEALTFYVLHRFRMP